MANRVVAFMGHRSGFARECCGLWVFSALDCLWLNWVFLDINGCEEVSTPDLVTELVVVFLIRAHNLLSVSFGGGEGGNNTGGIKSNINLFPPQELRKRDMTD